MSKHELIEKIISLLPYWPRPELQQLAQHEVEKIYQYARAKRAA